jgi:hypothetical protein
MSTWTTIFPKAWWFSKHFVPFTVFTDQLEPLIYFNLTWPKGTWLTNIRKTDACAGYQSARDYRLDFHLNDKLSVWLEQLLSFDPEPAFS